MNTPLIVFSGLLSLAIMVYAIKLGRRHRIRIEAYQRYNRKMKCISVCRTFLEHQRAVFEKQKAEQ